MFKYCWVWDKKHAIGHLTAKIRPMCNHEDVAIFGQGKIHYYPQMVKMLTPTKTSSVEGSRTGICGGKTTKEKTQIIRTHAYPKTILGFGKYSSTEKLHPTQKPVALIEYLIKTYTNEGELILDNCIGSGTTAIAALNTRRQYIGIEMDKGYFNLACDRVANHVVAVQEDLL